MSSQTTENQDKNKDELKENRTWLSQLKEWLFKRNFLLISALKLTFPQAVILFVIQQLQKFAIVSRLSSNPTISHSPQMVYVDKISSYILLQVTDPNLSNALVISSILLTCQILILFCYLFPFTSEVVNAIISKFIVNLMQMVLTIPSMIVSASGIAEGKDIQINAFLYCFSLLNNLIYETMQFQCSFQRQHENVLVRSTRPFAMRLFSLTMMTLFPILTKFMYPLSFLMYILIMLAVQIYKWAYYLRRFIYFDQTFMNLQGLTLSLTISANLCYLAIYTMDNAIIAENVLLFISTFCLFLGNFFIVFRNNIVKDTIINQQLKGEDQVALYCLFYWHCYRRLAQKKNQLYVSSLLKKHMNDCVDTTCCCRHRQRLYDPNLKIFGNPQLQPHFDKLFIRHYLKKLLADGLAEFPKSPTLAFLVCSYNIEVLQMIPQTMQLIRRLNKMQQKHQLSFAQQFLLFCMKKKTSKKILLINHKRGDLNLQSVRDFDQQLAVLSEGLRNSVKSYYILWKHLHSQKISQTALLDICKRSLELMFSMQKNYKHLKAINTESSELRTIMLFYSRLILHDIHLLSEIKKDIRQSHERSVLLNSLQSSTIQLFGPRTMTLVALQSGKIRWSSKNSHVLFDYNREDFHSLTIKHLMPKYFADRHDSYVQRWKQTGHHVKLNRTSYLWGSARDGHCFGLLMFVKVVPLPHQQQFAFFACLQKLDDQNQVICGPYGQIYGAGQLFSKVLGLSPNVLQELQLNLQVFLPAAFDYFLQYFYPNLKKLKNVKRIGQLRRQGFFPDNLQNTMRDMTADRNHFLKRNGGQNAQGFEKQYLGFIRQKMQELTCSISGEYISFLIAPFKIPALQHEDRDVIVLKVSSVKKDNIQKYYSQLQKMINRLQSLAEEEQTKRARTIQKKTKHDFFRAFLNPKRIKRLLQKQMNQKQQSEADAPQVGAKSKPKIVRLQEKAQSQSSNSLIAQGSHKTAAMVVAHRKRLALGAQNEIKNERVRYNLWKLKKMLLEEGVISRYTYNMLIGKQAGNFQSLRSLPQNGPEETEVHKTLVELYEERNASQQDRNSVDHDSQGELANKQNDNQTFNSASSSATFISMTNHVKMFKLKLRSLNTPRPLLFLNIALVIAIVSGMSSLIYSAMINSKNIDYGLKQFNNNEQANVIVDSLIMGQLNIKNINYNSSNPIFVKQKQFLLNKVVQLFSSQMYNRAIYQKIDPQILSYLTMQVIDDQTLYVRQFFELTITQIVNDQFFHVQKYFVDTINSIIAHSNNNIFFQRIITQNFTIFIVFAMFLIVFFTVTLPIVYKIQIKIREIYDLLSKISPNQKQRYFRHFSSLQEQFRKNQNIQCSQLANLIVLFQTRNKNGRNATKAAFSQDQQGIRSQHTIKAKEPSTEQSNISTDRQIYVKIIGIYLLLLSAILANYLYVLNCHNNFNNASQVFTKIFNQKTMLTLRVAECYYELQGYTNQAPSFSDTLPLIDALYNSYQLSGISFHFKQIMRLFVEGDTCQLINDQINPSMMAFCRTINNGTFKSGGIDNLYYSQRKMEQRLTQYYEARNWTQNDQSVLIHPPYFYSQEFFQLNTAYFFSSLMLYNMYQQIHNEIQSFASSYVIQIYISSFSCLALMVVFMSLWIFVYLRLAEKASYINAFLLLIPFDVLSQNPYIKLYIRNEFDYKAATY